MTDRKILERQQELAEKGFELVEVLEDKLIVQKEGQQYLAIPGSERLGQLPLRVVLLEEEKLKGLIENSFSMGVSQSRVLIFWSGKAYSMLGEHVIDGVKDAQANALKNPGSIVVDPLSPSCPIEIDWKAWLDAKSKFDKRNAPFKVKQGVTS